MEEAVNGGTGSLVLQAFQESAENQVRGRKDLEEGES